MSRSNERTKIKKETTTQPEHFRLTDDLLDHPIMAPEEGVSFTIHIDDEEMTHLINQIPVHEINHLLNYYAQGIDLQRFPASWGSVVRDAVVSCLVRISPVLEKDGFNGQFNGIFPSYTTKDGRFFILNFENASKETRTVLCSVIRSSPSEGWVFKPKKDELLVINDRWARVIESPNVVQFLDDETETTLFWDDLIFVEREDQHVSNDYSESELQKIAKETFDKTQERKFKDLQKNCLKPPMKGSAPKNKKDQKFSYFGHFLTKKEFEKRFQPQK